MIFILKPLVLLVGKLTDRNHRPEILGDAVFIKLLGGGSLLVALPALIGFRRKYPNTRMRLLTTQDVVPFAEAMGVFDEFVVVDTRSPMDLLRSGIRSYRSCFRTDTIIDLEVHSRLTTVFSVLTCARNRLGFYLEDAYWRRGVATHLVYFNSFAGSYHFYEKILQVLGVDPVSMEESRAQVLHVLGPPNEEWCGSLVIGCACSGLGAERQLTPEQWMKVFTQRMDPAKDRTVAFLGGPGDRPAAQAIVDGLKKTFPNLDLRNLCGETPLKESLNILAAADDFWGIDSGLMHFARLFGIRSVSYWGPTHPDTRLKPVPGLEEETVYRRVPCSPCIHVTEDPPCRGNNICIQNLFTEEPKDWIGLVESSNSPPGNPEE
jgi:ADP-heptose:LPS heptosyltransferase